MLETIREKISSMKGEFWGYEGLPPREKSDIYDELLMKEKKLANEIYIQRCKEKDL